MLKVPDGSIHLSNFKLSNSTLKRAKQKVFRSTIEILNQEYKKTNSLNSAWAYDQISFSPEVTRTINRILRKFGFILSEKYRDSNVIICYRHVDGHNDAIIKGMNGKPDFHVGDQSLTFVPLYGHEGAQFILFGDDSSQTVDIEDGYIVTFDHNKDHKVDFPPGPYTGKLKFGLSFFLDKIDQKEATQ